MSKKKFIDVKVKEVTITPIRFRLKIKLAINGYKDYTFTAERDIE